MVVNNITGRYRPAMRYDAMPAVVYASPEVAVVGLTKEEAEERRDQEPAPARIPMAINARYIAENPDEVRTLHTGGAGKRNPTACSGVHMVGGACSEMIFGATAMLETELREEEIEEVVFPHPTTSEIIQGCIHGGPLIHYPNQISINNPLTTIRHA